MAPGIYPETALKRAMPPLNALRAFEAAARSGSFKRAASELNVSQSAISHQIKHLEKLLNIRLFERGSRAVTLTEAGRNYLPFLQQAFDSISDGTRVITRATRADVLTVRTYSSFAMRWLIARLDRFESRHPHLKLRLITSQLDPVLPDSDTDLAVIIGQPGKKNGVHYQYLFTPSMFPVCSPRLLAGRPRLERPDELSAFTLLQVYPSAGDWRAWLDAHGVSGINPDAGVRVDSYDHALKMAARGMGVALGMQPYVSEDLAAGLLLAPLPQHAICAPGDWYLIYLEAHREAAKIRAFQSWLLDEMAADPSIAELKRAVRD